MADQRITIPIPDFPDEPYLFLQNWLCIEEIDRLVQRYAQCTKTLDYGFWDELSSITESQGWPIELEDVIYKALVLLGGIVYEYLHTNPMYKILLFTIMPDINRISDNVWTVYYDLSDLPPLLEVYNATSLHHQSRMDEINRQYTDIVAQSNGITHTTKHQPGRYILSDF